MFFCVFNNVEKEKIIKKRAENQFQLRDRVPKEYFYRRLRGLLNLDALYRDNKMFYVSSGQKSIDPVVFFKFCLVGYLENIISDRKLAARF